MEVSRTDTDSRDRAGPAAPHACRAGERLAWVPFAGPIATRSESEGRHSRKLEQQTYGLVAQLRHPRVGKHLPQRGASESARQTEADLPRPRDRGLEHRKV